MIQMGNFTVNKRAEEYTPEPHRFARQYTVLVQIDMEFYFEPVHDPQEQHKIHVSILVLGTLLFMCIETAEIVPMLLHHGADMYEKYEGYNLEAHPTTQPHVARLVRELKGHYAAKRVLGQ